MNNKNGKRYSRIAKLIGILSGFVFVLGTSYAVFRVTTTGEKENVVSAGKLDVRIENEQNEINLGNTLPQTEEEGKQNTPYTFDIVNRGNINAMYDLYLEVNNDSTLDARVIRYYLTVVEDGEEKQITPVGNLIANEEESTKEGKKAYKIDTKYLDVNKTNNYKLYLWIDYDTEAEQAINKTFKANIRVDAEQIYKGNKLIKQVDVSENNDGSVTAYMYGNDTVVIKGKGQIRSGLSDSLVFVNDEALPNYKKVLQSMGVDVSNINTLDELQTYLDSQDSDFKTKLDDQAVYICAKETLKDMDKDSDKVTDVESLVAYLQELGWMDEEGTPTEAGEEFFTKFEAKYNKNYSLETQNPKKIILEEGITNVPRDLFQGNENITEVKIPSSVKTIDDFAFSNCSNLTSITIPNSVTSIGNRAFSYCNNLTAITIPDSVTRIGTYAFSSCSNLTSITLQNGITSIGKYAFSSCNITSITIPSSVTSIGEDAFSYCINLASITIPNSVTSIGSSAFSHCSNITSITIPNSVTSIGSAAFYNCSNLTSITLPKKLPSDFNSNWFTHCSSLKKVDIANDAINFSTYDGALYNKEQSKLVFVPAGKVSIEFSNKLNTIGSYSFSGCINLASITIPNSVTSIGEWAFNNCSNLTSITIPNSVTSIGAFAFSRCSNLTSITIPSSVTSLRVSMFEGCTSLADIQVDSDNKYYSSEDGVLYNENKTTLVRVPEGKKQVTIPTSVTSIGDDAFSYCINLASITIPNSVTSIGDNAFSGCKNLTSITIPNNVTSIGYKAFEYCSNLTSITIPNSVTSMGSYAFDNCSKLTTINIDNTKAYVEANWYSDWKKYCSANVNYLRT